MKSTNTGLGREPGRLQVCMGRRGGEGNSAKAWCWEDEGTVPSKVKGDDIWC